MQVKGDDKLKIMHRANHAGYSWRPLAHQSGQTGALEGLRGEVAVGAGIGVGCLFPSLR